MLFTKPVFLIFILVVYLLYLRLPFRKQNILLFLSSYVFYGWWDVRFLVLLALSTIVDYSCGKALGAQGSDRKRKAILAISIATNLGILGFFKYFDFFIQNLNEVLNWFNLNPGMNVLGIVVPVGISFYTFQTMSYTIDVYRRHESPCESITDFAVYVAFFPQLVAGPIERPSSLLTQITSPQFLTWSTIQEGLYLILQGYFLKMVIADNAGKIVDPVFASTAPSGIAVLSGVYAYALQIYGDFAGYSRIARGLSRLMGFHLMQNFRRPYFAIDPSDFWRRWHISLSSWLRDYLYIPLGGNRVGRFRRHGNLLITMILGGLWHGAAWNFVLWGLYHGILLIGFHFIQRPLRAVHRNLAYQALRVVLYFHLTCFGWLLFRAESLTRIQTLLHGLTQWSRSDLHSLRTSLLAGAILVAFYLLYDGACALQEYLGNHGHSAFGSPRVIGATKLLCTFLMLSAIYALGQRGGTGFIYFQF